MRSLTTAALCLGLAAPALAQEMPMAPADTPFAFAESQRKKGHMEEVAAEMAASGSRVIGGERAQPGEWPWQVALMVAGYPPSSDTQFCGGTMVLDRWVLTAAHCVLEPNDQGVMQVIPANSIAVRVGTHILNSNTGDLVPADAIFAHPGYDPFNFDNDIALVRLSRVPDAQYRTITVPTPDFGDVLDQEGVPTYVTGWGLINGAQAPNEMYEAQIQMFDRSQCNGAMMDARAEAAVDPFIQIAQTFNMKEETALEAWDGLLAKAPLPLTPNMLCSGTYEGGKTSCQGDSGGPLVVPLDDGSFVQAGVVSWGLTAGPGQTCAEDAFFSAYTRVSNYLSWLETTISRNP